MAETALRTDFLNAVSPAERSRWDTPQLEGELAQIVDEARVCYPEVTVDSSTFMRYLAERAATAPAGWLAELPAGDLYLACACANSNVAAIAVVERRHFPRVESIVRGKLDATLADEAMQRVREHLFVGDRPHISDYAGRGELGKWLTITAVRAGLRVLRDARRETPLDEPDLDALVGSASDLELQHLRTRYHADFKAAFAEAFADLEPRERRLLRHNVVDRLGVEAIAELHGAHKSTASRWLKSARDTLIAKTKKRLRTRLAISPTECESILRLLADHVDVTLEGVLRETTG
ncbi:MAG TPA: sigma-70 family RNA polymerase sigma factor [Kofleriaceae bacterium]|nr:sigma-70 family RNA polymerase sigma factor [Kofleriaceae bacterium]